MDATEIKRFSEQVSRQLFDHILPFWCGPALDQEQGGWMAWLSNDLKPDRTQPKGLVVNSRILWTFAAVHQARPAQQFREMAERAFDVVFNRFWDSVNGGAFWQLTDDWHVRDDSKKIYGQAFSIYALAEYYQDFKDTAALTCAQELFELVERHAHDSRHGGYWEVRLRDWSEAGPEARLSEKDMNEKKSMNTHLHVLEAYTNLYRVWPDPRVADRLRELIGLFERHILDSDTHHFHHFFDEAWNVRSDTHTYGHDIEGSWLLCEAAEVLEDTVLLGKAREIAVKQAHAVMNEAIGPGGGLCYEGRSGKVIDSRRECWPQAEAMVGFLNAFELTGDETFFRAGHGIWEYIEQHLVDRVHGEWFWRINEDGRPDATLPKVSEWKGPYHASRACLETMHRLGRTGTHHSAKLNTAGTKG